MKSKTSFFNPTLLKKNLSRFAPAWALFALLLFLTGPLLLLRDLGSTDLMEIREARVEGLWEDLYYVCVWYAYFAAAIFAVLVFKYLHGARAAYMTHAFPMTRTCLFVTNAVTGLLFYLAPLAVNVLLMQGILLLTNVGGHFLGFWKLLSLASLAWLCFYGIAVFAMVLAGNSFVALLSYFALTVLPLVLPVLLLLPVRFYLYGLELNLPEWMLRLSPIVGMNVPFRNVPDVTISPWLLLVLYAALGLVLLVLAWQHNRVRQVERAGDAMAYSWARVAFRLIFTLCCALGIGWMLAAIFGTLNDRTAAFLPYALLGCFLGWFGSSMMLERTVKVFRNKKIWIGFAVFAGVLILGTASLRFDLLGVRRRVPETAQVASVDLWTRDDASWAGLSDRITLTDPKDVDTVRKVHSLALADQSENDSVDSLFGYDDWSTLHICYHLEGGGTLTRAYRILDAEKTDLLASLYSRPALCVEYYDRVLPKTFRWAALEGLEDPAVTEVPLDENGEPVDYEEFNYSSVGKEIRDPEALRTAVLADAAAGRLPIWNAFTSNDFWRKDSDEIVLNLTIAGNETFGDDMDITLQIFSTATMTIALFRR